MKYLADNGTSQVLEFANGFPLFKDQSLASQSTLDSISLPKLQMRRPRSQAGIFLHSPSSNAFLAALTAMSTSSCPASWTQARTFSVAGLQVENFLPDLASTYSLLMNSRVSMACIPKLVVKRLSKQIYLTKLKVRSHKPECLLIFALHTRSSSDVPTMSIYLFAMQNTILELLVSLGETILSEQLLLFCQLSMEPEDLQCPVCLEVAREAVESHCCGHVFCYECVELIRNKDNKCSLCNAAPFKTNEAKSIRRIISNIKVQCTNPKCGQKVANSDLKTHMDYCKFGKTKCRVCSETFLRQELVGHTVHSHQDETLVAIINYHENKSRLLNPGGGSKVGGSKQVKSTSTVIDPQAKLKNRIGRDAFLGTSGKYYCGGPLIVKCSCCDGSCGPTNGCNCLGCMELDVLTRSLPKGYLVNAKGTITKVDLKKNEAYCGIKIGGMFKSGKCSAGNQCQLCLNLTRSLQRYESILSD